MEVKGQLVGVDIFLLPCGSWESEEFRSSEVAVDAHGVISPDQTMEPLEDGV